MNRQTSGAYFLAIKCSEQRWREIIVPHQHSKRKCSNCYDLREACWQIPPQRRQVSQPRRHRKLPRLIWLMHGNFRMSLLPSCGTCNTGRSKSADLAYSAQRCLPLILLHSLTGNFPRLELTVMGFVAIGCHPPDPAGTLLHHREIQASGPSNVLSRQSNCSAMCCPWGSRL